MSERSIRVEGVSKRYLLGGPGPGSESFREMLMSLATEPLRRLRQLQGRVPDEQTFWALKDVSFEVAEGAVLGIIGANGAGKSTLLKVLSRITEPSEGRIRFRGRLATLLEVGTGFHPELSGRENIFLNGAILGMSRRDVAQRFDEIVAFADVERFLDMPVKRYSSGMYVRLAFSVAAHMEPDILLVDEVLSVGDVAFQKKCLNKMSDVSSAGRTVLFVSHNLDAVQRLCPEVLYLKGGRTAFHGATDFAIGRYLEGGRHLAGEADLSDVAERWGNGEVRITGIAVEDGHGVTAASLMAGQAYRFRIAHERMSGDAAIRDAYFNIELADVRGVTVWMVSSLFTDERVVIDGACGRCECAVEDFNLAPGEYTLSLYLGRRNGETLDCLRHAVTVTVSGGDYFGSGHPGLPEHCRSLTRARWRNVS